MNKQEEKYFKIKFIAESDEEALYNTFPCYVALILICAAVILEQWEWNSLTVFLLTMICVALYRIGYKIGKSL